MLELSRAMLGFPCSRPNLLTLFTNCLYLQPAAEHAYREGALARSEYRLEVEPLVNSHVRVRHASLTILLVTY